MVQDPSERLKSMADVPMPAGVQLGVEAVRTVAVDGHKVVK